MNPDIFETANLNETLQAASDEALIEEIARRMANATGFYEKTCHHNRLIEAVELAHYRCQAAEHRARAAA